MKLGYVVMYFGLEPLIEIKEPQNRSNIGTTTFYSIVLVPEVKK